MGNPPERPADASSAAEPYVGPATEIEHRLAELLAGVVQLDRVCVEAHFFTDLGADSLLMAQFCARVRKQPGLPSISIKDIYRAPTLRSLCAELAAAPTPAAPPMLLEPAAEAGGAVPDRLADLLAGVLKLTHLDRDAHFFNDLGADSLLMAQFCARVRKQPGLPSISIKDIYRTPTLASLCAVLVPADTGPAPTIDAEADAEADADVRPAPRRPGALAHFLCGTAQMLFLFGGIFLSATLSVVGFDWVAGGDGIGAGYLRLVAFLAAITLGALLLPLAAKWLLIGRFTAGEFPAWGATYFRFWVAKTVLQRNPIVALMVGSPLYPLYLRALGARIGPGTAIFTRTVALCPDLFSVGAGTVVRKGAVAQCYRAHDGMIQLGPVVLGRDVVLGEAAVLDIDTEIGDGGQLGHSSALHRGQRVPAGEFWHGSPAAAGNVDFRLVPPAECPRRRRIGYACFQILGLLFVSLPLAIGVITVLTLAALWASGLSSDTQGDMSTVSFYGQVLVMGAVLVLGSIVVGLALVLTAPAALNRWVRPGQVHPLYGTQYALHRSIARLSNVRFFTMLFGDSSAIVHYLQGMGYRLAPVQQTGTNFGMTVTHDSPRLVSVGSGTVVADGLHLINAELSATSFRLAQTRVGANNFLGNAIQYPARGRTGDNCLLATKVMVPIDGPIRDGVGLLGSPAFEIPRLVARDADLAVTDPARVAALVRAKNRHNATTFLAQLLKVCGSGFFLTLCAEVAAGPHKALGPASFGLAAIVLFAVNLGYSLAVSRLAAHLLALYPNGCSVYERDFWRHERYWKLSDPAGKVFVGTPLRPWLWRALGARVGRRVLDDGLFIPEKSLVTIGDHATLNAGSIVQAHSQEDGAFKSDRSVLEPGVTLGVAGFVHYGVIMGAGSVLAPDSFLMKGEEVPPDAQWGGNPARELASDAFRRRVPHPITPADCAEVPAVVETPARLLTKPTRAPDRTPARTKSAAVPR